MIHDDEREIMEFLHRVAATPGYDRRVWLHFAEHHRGRKAWRLVATEDRQIGSERIEPIFVDVADLASLRERGYLDGPDPQGGVKIKHALRYTLTQKGLDLRERGYVELPDPPSGLHQHNYISGENVAIAQANASNISQVVGPQVDLNLLREMLAELRQALAESDLPEMERNSYDGAIARIEGQLTAKAPSMAIVAAAWQYIALIGDGESVLQAGERAIALFHALAPHIQALLGK